MSLRRIELMEARAKLEELIAQGDEVIIVKRGVELARLTPTHPEAAQPGPAPSSRLVESMDEDKDGLDLLLDEVGD
jgi:prevent-host-death family protein